MDVASQIAVINEGHILVIGTPDEVKNKQDPVIQNFLRAGLKRHPTGHPQHAINQPPIL